jgi:tRNA(adenine34) deaminase
MNDEYFMREALKEAEKAFINKEFPVGCIITYNDKIIARGSRKGSFGKTPGETDHAEINTIKILHKTHPDLPRDKMTIYCTMEPCLMCLSAIIFSGFNKIVYAYEDVMGGGCNIKNEFFPGFYRERMPEIKRGVLRNQSLELFKNFFKSPDNIYWKGSHLSEYTLSL